MNHYGQENRVTPHALSDEDEMRGVSIDGYEVEFTTKVALMPVDIVAAPRTDEEEEGQRG
jgi:hypothetical protein